jgi:hypothetical protein
MRREFELPSFDVDHLNSTELPWETIRVETTKWVLIHERPIPLGYTSSRATVALQIAPGYPEAEIDMAYFNPPLVRSNGSAITSLASATIDGSPYQRWSRHRTPTSPWRPGEDDISSHLVLVDDWLDKEAAKP